MYVCICGMYECVHTEEELNPFFPPILSVCLSQQATRFSVGRVLAGYGAGAYQRVLLQWIHSGRPGSR